MQHIEEENFTALYWPDYFASIENEYQDATGLSREELKDYLRPGNLEYFDPEEVKVFVHGKYRYIPRSQVAFSESPIGYQFSKIRVTGKIWPEELKVLASLITRDLKAQEVLQHDLNYMLINHYADGTQYIGPHNDSEKGLTEPTIVSLSLGVSRDFIFQEKGSKNKKVFTLNDGDLFVFYGKTNSAWKHSLPKRLRVTEERFNLTLRSFRVD